MSRARHSTVGLLAVSNVLALAVVGGAAEPADSSTPADTAERATPPETAGKDVKAIYVPGGRFWGQEKYIGLVNGVVATDVGYANGANASATYGDGSGHAEAVKVVYDPAVAPLPSLLDLFYDAVGPRRRTRDQAVAGATAEEVLAAHRGREWSAHTTSTPRAPRRRCLNERIKDV